MVSKEYLTDLRELAQNYIQATNAANAYYKSVNDGFKESPYYRAIRDTAIENMFDSLTEKGINASVVKPLRDQLITAVTSGASYATMTENLRNSVIGDGGQEGLLSRYAGTYTVTAMAMYTRQYMAAIHKDLGFKWFRYIGSNIKTTREFCLHMTEKEWVHESEFEAVVSGVVDGHQCELYHDLPRGMIVGTNATNFEVNLGGWNCQHSLIGVSDEAVPKEIRDSLEQRNAANKKIKDEEADVMKRLNDLQGGKEDFVGADDKDIANKRKAADKFAKENNLSQAERAAINMYSARDYEAINPALRDDKMTPELQSLTNTLNRGLDKLKPYEGVVYRGVETMPQDALQRYIDAYNTKGVVAEKAFTSTSMDRDKAFAGNLEFEIISKTGREITPIAKFGETEREVLFKSGLEFRVTRYEHVNGVHEIKMEEI